LTLAAPHTTRTANRVRTEFARWGKVIKDAGIKGE